MFWCGVYNRAQLYIDIIRNNNEQQAHLLTTGLKAFSPQTTNGPLVIGCGVPGTTECFTGR